MRITTLTDEAVALQPAVATIGFFDGVHLGHRYLLAQVIEEAGRRGVQPMAITFDRHPREVLDSDYRPALLTTLDDKLSLIGQSGIEHCVVLRFTRELAAMPARTFMADILRCRLNVCGLVLGYDNRFGHDRDARFGDYVEWGRELGIDVSRGLPYDVDGLRVSSSVVRRLVAAGDMELARKCLGRPYAITGKVVGGYQEGRKIGFPTANIVPAETSLLHPANGVYGVMVGVDGIGNRYRGMMNIGRRPTFNGQHTTFEVNILDFDGDLYGKTLTVEFCHRVRDERKFTDIGQLVAQLHEDRMTITKMFDNDDNKKHLCEGRR